MNKVIPCIEHVKRTLPPFDEVEFFTFPQTTQKKPLNNGNLKVGTHANGSFDNENYNEISASKYICKEMINHSEKIFGLNCLFCFLFQCYVLHREMMCLYC